MDIISEPSQNVSQHEEMRECKICMQTFLTGKLLNDHYSMEHFFTNLSEKLPMPIMPPFRCPFCCLEFKAQKAFFNLIKHMGYKHRLNEKFLNERSSKINRIRELYESVPPHVEMVTGSLLDLMNDQMNSQKEETAYEIPSQNQIPLSSQPYLSENYQPQLPYLDEINPNIQGIVEDTKNEPSEFPLKSAIESRYMLIHACNCYDANCILSNCQKMKRIVSHTRDCENGGDCPICKQTIDLCYSHAKVCCEVKCPVLFCDSIKHRLVSSVSKSWMSGNTSDLAEFGIPPKWNEGKSDNQF